MENAVNVAQLVEHWVVAPAVAGSSPVVHPSTYAGVAEWQTRMI
jgi:hypothetical protein